MTEETTPRKRHQRRSPDQWRALIEAQARSGLSQAAFCEREGLCAGSFWNWRRRLQDSVAEGAPDSIAQSRPPTFGTRPGNPSCRHCREGSQSRRWSDAIQSGTSKVEVASTAAASTVVALDCQFQGSISSRSRMRAVGRRPRISVK